jgi:hypothetical protein
VREQLPDLLSQVLDMLLTDRDAQSGEGRVASLDSPNKNRKNGLTEPEAAEMNTFIRVNQIMILLKARAHKVLRDRRTNMLS